MAHARAVAGPKSVLCGNIDPVVLYSDLKSGVIEREVAKCITEAKGYHVLNLGHGVEKDTSEEAVARFVETARAIKL